MSMKDVIHYQWSLQAQYVEMEDNLRELTELAQEKVISPEQLEMVKQMCDQIKTNKDRVDYIVYLLHRPVRKKKQNRYERENAKKVKMLTEAHSTLEDVKQENQDCLDNIKSI